MSSDLSRSLVDAAATGIANVMLEKCPPNVAPTLPPGCTATDLSRAAVAAVLETLSASLDESARHHDALGWISFAELRGLAADVKEERG